MHDLLDDRFERGHLGRVAIEHLVVQRQALGGLHHSEHDLARNDPLLGHAEVAQVAFLLGQAARTNGGHVVEHDGQILIDQRAQQAGEHRLDFLVAVDQYVHGTQQVLVGDRLAHDAGQADGL